MNKRYLVLLAVVLVLTVVNLTVFLSHAKGQARAKEAKGIILSTGEPGEPYEVIGIISARSGTPEINDASKLLIDAAKKVQADYVANVRYVSHAGYLLAYGTAGRAK